MQTTKPRIRIDWATHEAAKYACVNWHYSKCLPVGKLVKVGAWENDKFIGVVVFGRGANKSLGEPYGCSQLECCELVRIAMTDHITPVSKIMMIAIKFLKSAHKELKLIVSFADIEKGHHGGIYQATKLAQEYPKRIKEQALENPSNLEGATPINTLHLTKPVTV
jgi:hypothetical protein